MPFVSNEDSDEHIRRVRTICLAMPGAEERLSHGEPTFFSGKVFAMISNNHHNDNHVAVWIPAAPGEQEAWIASAPKRYYRPPYVGVKGWVAIELSEIDDEDLAVHLHEAHRFIASKPKVQKSRAKKRR